MYELGVGGDEHLQEVITVPVEQLHNALYLLDYLRYASVMLVPQLPAMLFMLVCCLRSAKYLRHHS